MNKPVDKFDSIRAFYDNEYYARRTRCALAMALSKGGARLCDMSGREVLDMACGTGGWPGYFHEQGASVAGIDLSQKAIDECERRFPEGAFSCGPVKSLSFADAHFDLVSCMGSLESFLDKPKALAEMKRVSKPDAAFLILVLPWFKPRTI